MSSPPLPPTIEILEDYGLAFKVYICFELYVVRPSQCEKCPYSEFFWSIYSRIWAEYKEILSIYSYSVQMRENMDQRL